MRGKFILTLLFVFFTVQWAMSQESGGNVNMKVVEQQEAHYPKGDQAFYQYVYSHLAFPQCVQGKTINDVVTISFDVMPDSSLTNFVIMKDVECNIGQIIVDILRPLKFAPSIQNGIKVKENLMFNFPIQIRN